MVIKVKTERPVRVAVVGAGVFGGFHAGKYAAHEDVQLVGIIDPDLDRATALAEKNDTQAFTSLDEVLDKVDAVSVCAPAQTHYRIARQVLEAGVHCLVEKPIALELDQADILVETARRKGLVLQVGHQERYVLGQFGILSRAETPVFIECRRAGPFSGRCMDVSVVMDLMIHDLDLVHQVARSPVRRAQADASFIHGDLADEVSAELTLESGTEVALFASRDAERKERSMKLVYTDGEVVIDFVNRTLTNTTPADLREAFGKEGPVNGDPLGYGIGQFIRCVQTGEEPVVSGGQAREALALALAITDAHGPMDGVREALIA